MLTYYISNFWDLSNEDVISIMSVNNSGDYATIFLHAIAISLFCRFRSSFPLFLFASWYESDQAADPEHDQVDENDTCSRRSIESIRGSDPPKETDY